MTISDRVKELGFPRGSYAVFGSGPLAVRGMREAEDIDIIVTTDYFNTLKLSGGWETVKLRDLHESLVKGDVSVFDSWAPDSWDIPQMIRDAEEIDGVPFVRLETVMEWKKIRNLPKDVRDIGLIEQYLHEHK